MTRRTSVGARSTWVLPRETVTQYSYFDDRRAVTEGADLPICCHVSPFPRSAPRACASGPSRRLRKLPPSALITEIHSDLVNDCHTFNFTIRISVVRRSTSASHVAGNAHRSPRRILVHLGDVQQAPPPFSSLPCMLGSGQHQEGLL